MRMTTIRLTLAAALALGLFATVGAALATQTLTAFVALRGEETGFSPQGRPAVYSKLHNLLVHGFSDTPAQLKVDAPRLRREVLYPLRRRLLYGLHRLTGGCFLCGLLGGFLAAEFLDGFLADLGREQALLADSGDGLFVGLRLDLVLDLLTALVHRFKIKRRHGYS